MIKTFKMSDYHTDVKMLEVDAENVYRESINLYAAFVKKEWNAVTADSDVFFCDFTLLSPEAGSMSCCCQ